MSQHETNSQTDKRQTHPIELDVNKEVAHANGLRFAVRTARIERENAPARTKMFDGNRVVGESLRRFANRIDWTREEGVGKETQKQEQAE